MHTVLLLSAGGAALVAGAELLVSGASKLARAFGISPLVIGLTIVAFGTSAPELAVSVAAALSGQADLALGNVVGSNIFNVLFILGISALIVPLRVDQKLVRFDVPLMIVLSVLVFLCALDGRFGRLEGALAFAALVAYTGWCIRAGPKDSPAIAAEYAAEFGADGDPGDGADPAKGTGRQRARWRRILSRVGLIGAGLVLLVAGSRWFVAGASEMARWFGVSELVIGLTIVAGGTSLPELATSVIAAMRGERDIAVGNVVGSNIFNILGVLGVSAAIASGGIAIAPQMLRFDLPVMIAVAAACLPIFFTGHRIARWEGALFVGYYMVYTVALVLVATESSALPAFRYLLLGFVAPLTTITLVVITARALRRRRGGNGDSV